MPVLGSKKGFFFLSLLPTFWKPETASLEQEKYRCFWKETEQNNIYSLLQNRITSVTRNSRLVNNAVTLKLSKIATMVTLKILLNIKDTGSKNDVDEILRIMRNN